jgi:hypothetical protein
MMWIKTMSTFSKSAQNQRLWRQIFLIFFGRVAPFLSHTQTECFGLDAAVQRQ